MTLDLRSIRYPLEALHRREGWRLDALRTELAAATRRHDTQRDHTHRLERDHRAAAQSAAPIAAAAIDPAAAHGRLVYLSGLRARLLAAAGALQAIERERERIRGDGRRQHARVEALAEHRQLHLRAEGSRQLAQRANVADRDWLATRAARGDPFAPQTDGANE